LLVVARYDNAGWSAAAVEPIDSCLLALVRQYGLFAFPTAGPHSSAQNCFDNHPIVAVRHARPKAEALARMRACILSCSGTA
jgi:hypothetical protein